MENLSIEELKEKFENFLFNIDDYLENIIDKANNQGYVFDYKYVIKNILYYFVFLSSWDE